MKWIYSVIAVLVGVPLVFFASIYVASEVGGEVVVLHRTAADGSVDRVRVWIVDDGEQALIEHGAPDAAWITRLADDPVITLERDGVLGRYHAVADPEARSLYHTKRREKYGWAHRYVALVSGDPSSARPSCCYSWNGSRSEKGGVSTWKSWM